ncbi:MAG: DUF2442 domain-containing protein [Planctomycetes bacterium]|nr:DUF2442 domain-containing protein [Planctomycetota bacterium]
MRIAELRPKSDWVLSIVADDGRVGRFDVSPYLQYEAFQDLRDPREFVKVFNGGYFVEWDCGADLSADTIEARWQVIDKQTPQTTA